PCHNPGHVELIMRLVYEPPESARLRGNPSYHLGTDHRPPSPRPRANCGQPFAATSRPWHGERPHPASPEPLPTPRVLATTDPLGVKACAIIPEDLCLGFVADSFKGNELVDGLREQAIGVRVIG